MKAEANTQQVAAIVSSDPDTGLIDLRFGSPILGMQLSAEDALRLAECLTNHAKAIQLVSYASQETSA